MPVLAEIVTPRPRQQGLEKLDRMIRPMFHEPLFSSEILSDAVSVQAIGMAGWAA